MRPLPDLTPLADAPSVYNQSQDDWLQILGGDLSAFDSLSSSLADQSAAAVAGGPAIGDTIDSLDTSLGQAISIFDTLSAADQAVDLTGVISEAFSLDSALVSNFDGWAPDIGSIASIFLTELNNWIGPIIGSVLGFMEAAINGLQSEIDDILFQFGTGFGTPS